MAKRRQRKEWVEIFEALGEAFFAVLHAEGNVLWRDLWEGSLRRLLIAAGFFFVAASFVFMLVALTVTGAVLAVQAIWDQPAWKAVLWVALAVFAIAASLGAVGYYRFVQRLQNPFATIGERVQDHLAWWRERLLRDERLIPEGETDGEPQTPPRGGGASEPAPAD